MIKRDLINALLRFTKFPVVGIFGPRQSGKTTLARDVFKNHKYLNFEDPDTQDFATTDPRGFLTTHSNAHGIILDEFQYVPQILSYIQLESDEKKRPGYFVLTGSQNFLMNQAITQSLAGRIGILTLLPLSLHELSDSTLLPNNVNEALVKGSYPRMYTDPFTPDEFYPSYIHSYVERDVRQLVNVENLRTFRKFIQLCAARVGQLLNVSDLAMHCGINQKTVNQWISILEASYIMYTLMPYHENFTKRVIKTPKLFFYDTGVACSLLGIKTPEELNLSPWKGHLFECMIVSDFYKQFYNTGSNPSLYFWRDKNGYIEIDCIVEHATKPVPIEIKSVETMSSDLFKGLGKWYELTETDASSGHLVYGGDLTQKRAHGAIVSWKKSGSLIDTIIKPTT
ncbi:MAG: ATP-binding protein [Candidatus Dependentiae bacterium]|nr:ATP-binding protein [Candidatus Dependentiae bacterium]